ncbi:MAG: restriction endonuclease subunit S [Candidatus Aminicenantes bacterium]|nr:restriction endonuclease subunit S [Candidatus Aminicenantes bacterium]
MVPQKNKIVCIEDDSSGVLKKLDGIDFPEGWQPRQLGSFCELRNEQVRPSDSRDLPYIGLEHIDSGEHVIRRHGSPLEVRSTKNSFKAGDILYGKLRPYLDKAAIVDFDGICSTDILVVRTDEGEAEPEFVVSGLHTRSFLKYAVSTTTGVNHPRTSWNALKKYWLHIPPLPEQQAIASILRTVQQAKEACERVVAATRQLEQSLLQYLFTYGPVPFDQADKVPLKETASGLIPERWNSVSLGDVLRLVYRYPSYYNISYVDDGVPEIRGELLKSNGRIETDRRMFRFISPETSGRFPRTQLEEGDIVMSVRGTMGKIGLVPQRLAGANMTANLLRLSPDRTRVLPEYLRIVLLSPRFLRRLNELSPQTTIKTIQAPVLKSIKIILPSMPEQCEIANHLLAVETKLAAEEARRDSLANLFQSLLHHLMTGKVRVTG